MIANATPGLSRRRPLSFGRIVRVVAWIRNIAVSPAALPAPGAPEDEVLRLARTSPHLLADLGFRRMCRQVGDGRAYWVRGGLGIAIARDGTVAVVDWAGVTPAKQGGFSAR